MCRFLHVFMPLCCSVSVQQPPVDPSTTTRKSSLLHRPMPFMLLQPGMLCIFLSPCVCLPFCLFICKSKYFFAFIVRPLPAVKQHSGEDGCDDNEDSDYMSPNSLPVLATMTPSLGEAVPRPHHPNTLNSRYSHSKC